MFLVDMLGIRRLQAIGSSLNEHSLAGHNAKLCSCIKKIKYIIYFS
ncbi:MAG TPA: hypothetical protein VFT71_01235 [Candidatus Nitrosocosmicus sp.]|nr:hypothetical protein [Candidatus Nitrosocosmicus sp.]